MLRSLLYEHVSYSCIPKRSAKCFGFFRINAGSFCRRRCFWGSVLKIPFKWSCVAAHDVFIVFFGCRMRFCSRVLTVGRKYQTLAVLRIKKSPHKEDGKTIFCGCGGLVLCFFGFNSRLPQFDCFPKSFAAKRQSDASIREIVINRVYKRFPKAGGVLKTKPSLSANTVK